MDSWTNSLSKYIEGWTGSPARNEESNNSRTTGRGVTVTDSDDEAQLSYPGTDDEEYEGDVDNSSNSEDYEDASEDDLAADVDEDIKEAERKTKQATGLTFRDILLGRKSTESIPADDEWETDEEASPDFPKLGEEVMMEKKRPLSQKETPPPKKQETSEPPKPAVEAAPVPVVENKPVAAAAAAATSSSSSFFKPTLPPRPAKPSLPPRRSVEKDQEEAKPEAESKTSKPSLPARPSLPPRRSVEKEAKPATGEEASSKEAAAEEKAEAAASPAPKPTPSAGPVASANVTQGGAAPLVQAAPQQAAPPVMPELSEEKKKLMQTVMEHRIKLIRIAKRLGVGADNHVIKQVIFRLDMTEQVKLHGRSSRAAVSATFKEAEERATALEEAGEDLNLTCTVLVIGKNGVGKSTLVNNLLGLEDDVEIDRHAGKTAIRQVKGEVYGVKMHFIDVPGLQSSRSESKRNRKILNAAKKITKKHMPDIVLYCDRLDVPSYDFADIPLFRDISNTFGASIWWNALTVFTHGGSRAPEDSTGQIANFEYFQNHRGYIVQQMIRQAAGDARILNPVSVVECHHATKRNEKGEKLLPSGQAWRTYILLLCYASQVLHDANVSLKLDNDMKGNKAAKNAQYAAFRRQQTPYPLFFNNLFQTRKPRRAQNLMDEEEALEIEAEENEMDALPGQEKDYPLNPFKQPLDQGDSRIDIPAPDPALAPTFDCDPSTNAHRYRYLENSNGWICRAIVEPDGLEHDDGINGFTAENYYGTVADPSSKDPRKKNPIPTYVMSQINMPEKDKLSFVAEIESSLTHKAKAAPASASDGKGEKPESKKPMVTTGGIDVQSLGRDIMYVARTETRMKQGENMKMCAGASAFRSSLKFPHTGPLAFGAKVEERVKLNRRLRLNVTAGAIGGKAADGRTNQYLKGANVQFMVKGNKKKGEPTKLQVIGTAMHWKKDIALGGDVQAIQMVGPDSALTARANLNSRGSGSIQLRLTSTDTIKYALVGVIPTISAIWGFIRGGE